MCTKFYPEIAYYNLIPGQNHIETIPYPILVRIFFILKIITFWDFRETKLKCHECFFKMNPSIW